MRIKADIRQRRLGAGPWQELVFDAALVRALGDWQSYYRDASGAPVARAAHHLQRRAPRRRGLVTM